MQERRLLRRVAAILFHRRAGFSANGMGVWKVPDERIMELGPRMAAFRGISHCYQRPTYEDWPYSVFTMAHGRSKEECDAILDSIAAETGISDRATLYSSTEFKKIRLLYFTEDYRAWERKHAGRVSLSAGYEHRALDRSSTSAPGSCSRAASTRPSGRCARSAAIRSSSPAGEGATIFDVDGNEYVDWVCSWGPLILGHAHPAVVDAVASAAADGTTFGAPTEREVSSRPRWSSRVPSVEMVRMTSSGTEATMSAIRAGARGDRARARAQVRRRLPRPRRRAAREAGSGLATQGIPASPGVPPAAAAATVIVPWNDRDAVDRGDRALRAGGDPRRAGAGQHGRRPARATASSSCCASAPTAPGRCSSSTR